jgi:PAS domain S-box-containing protein
MRGDGSRFWASGLLMPLREPRAGFVKILRDRTEQHEAEAQLRQSEERFRLLATNIPQLVFRSQADGNRTWPSPQWISFTGLDEQHSLGLGWLDAIHEDDRVETLEAWNRARELGEYHVAHRVRRNSDGEYRWHQTRARPIDSEVYTADWVGTMTDVHDMRGLQDRQQVLIAELQHRTRNLLGIVHSIAAQTLKSNTSLEAFGADFAGRLRALGRVQGLLSHSDVDLRALVHAELSAHADSEVMSNKIRIEGPGVALPAATAQALGLALHELATNAVKYGALSQAPAQLRVSWRMETSEDRPMVALDWIEQRVAMSAEPRKRGFGTELIEKALPYQLSVATKLEFRPDGIHCAIKAPFEDMSSGGT